MKLSDLFGMASSALGAQATRIRTISENLANADTAYGQNDEPYRRRTTVFKSALDRADGIHKVSVREIAQDQSEPQLRYEPNHPLADSKGYVRYPDISSILEMADLRDAERSYKANMQIVESAKRLLRTTLDVIR